MSKPKTNDRDSYQATAERHMEQMQKGERRRKLQAVNKKIKRGYEPKPARRRDWLPDDPEAWDEVDYAQAERVMPLDERERRRTLEQAIYAEPGADAATIAQSLAAGSAQPDTTVGTGTLWSHRGCFGKQQQSLSSGLGRSNNRSGGGRGGG